MPCPSCGEPVPVDDAFCEVCGAAMAQLAAPVAPPPPTEPCPTCGSPADRIDADGYCGACGARRTPQMRDHLAAALEGVAAVTDRGRRHHRNEDAFAMARNDGRGLLALVVCDGVSSAPRSDVAAQAAADAACRRLAGVAIDASTDERDAAMTDAVRCAQEAVVRVAGGHMDARAAPSCTFVGALVGTGAVTVGWVGDSRAYLIVDGVAAPITVDHSWLAEQIATGRPEADVLREPAAHAITRWLGADQIGTPAADVRTLVLERGGRLLLCSDGLWNVSTAEQIAALATAPSSTAAADALVAFANDAGGPDNITVILCDVGPAGPGKEPT